MRLVTVASPVSEDVMVRTTSDCGCASSTTLNVSVPPASVTVVEPSGSETVNPATSSSAFVADTVWSLIGSNELSEFVSSIETVIVEVWVPSIMSSSNPVTVTFCGVFQFSEVKVSELVTEISVESEELIENATSVIGRPVRTTVKRSVEPDSSTPVDPSVSAIVNPATSSSVVVTETV